MKDKNHPPIDWPEPIVRVQSLSESGILKIPEIYIKPISDRPCFVSSTTTTAAATFSHANVNIPVIDFKGLMVKDQENEIIIMNKIYEACKEWGFFQVLNHGVDHEVMDKAREVWYGFFHQPMEIKQSYANTPKTYEGYGSRLGVQKGAKLDWGDYYFLHCLPLNLKDHNKWPSLPSNLRQVIDEYSEQVIKFCGKLMKILSLNLGLKEDVLQNAFGGDNIGTCLRVNFYPKCPQPELTLGLSSHSDPGGLTVLLPDENVAGLQVKKDGQWITVKPAPHAFIVNIGDQMQILSNAIYKSVEHRVAANSNRERISLAFFYNPKSDLPLGPANELITSDRPVQYPTMTFDEYRLYMRTRGPQGKTQLEESPKSIKTPQLVSFAQCTN